MYTQHYKFALGWIVDPALPDERRQHHAPIYNVDEEADAVMHARAILEAEQRRVPQGTVILAALFRDREVVHTFPEFRK